MPNTKLSLLLSSALLAVSSWTAGVDATPGTLNKVCTGNPPRYNGKLCATTTRYNDDTKGACGCGTGNGWAGSSEDAAFPWVKNMFTAAGSKRLFGFGSTGQDADWCGGGCGSCWKLTSVGDVCTENGVSKGKPAAPGQTITVMITNSCPDTVANKDWCANPNKGVEINRFGFGYHFDIWETDAFKQLGWDNPIVTFERVSCTGVDNSPTLNHWDQCECKAKGVGQPFPDPLLMDMAASIGMVSNVTMSRPGPAEETQPQQLPEPVPEAPIQSQSEPIAAPASAPEQIQQQAPRRLSTTSSPASAPSYKSYGYQSAGDVKSANSVKPQSYAAPKKSSGSGKKKSAVCKKKRKMMKRSVVNVRKN